MERSIFVGIHFLCFCRKKLMFAVQVGICDFLKDRISQHQSTQWEPFGAYLTKQNTCKHVYFYKLVKNEPYQIFTNICKPNLANFTSILRKIGSKRVIPNYFD
jgi:hypothetical protein